MSGMKQTHHGVFFKWLGRGSSALFVEQHEASVTLREVEVETQKTKSHAPDIPPHLAQPFIINQMNSTGWLLLPQRHQDGSLALSLMDLETHDTFAIHRSLADLGITATSVASASVSPNQIHFVLEVRDGAPGVMDTLFWGKVLGKT
jgi:hypothetical protein